MRTDCSGFGLFLLSLFAIALLAETLWFGFMSDDFVLVHRVVNEGYFTSWGGDTGDAFFRPVTVVSYLADNFIWGLRPFGYHLTNILWHICCSLLVYLLSLQLFLSRRMAVLAGLLFLLLGSHSESVSWISGRTDLIAAAFGLASTVLLLRGSFLSLPLLALALLAKESAIVLPAVWIFLVPWRKGKSASGWIAPSGLILSAIYALLRFLQGDVSGNLASAGGSTHLASVAGNLLRYLLRVFIPPLPGSLRPFLEGHIYLIPLLAGVFLICLLYPLYRRSREDFREVLRYMAMFLVSLLPVVFMSVSLFDTRSERFLYLPGVFAVLALVKWAFSVLSLKRAAVLILVFAVLQGAFLYRSNRNWKRAGEICREVISSGDCTNAPDNYRGAYVFRNGCSEAMELFGE